MKTVAIIQARMTSSRLPGKVLMPLAGQPMLARQIERTRRSRVDEIVIATTTNASDDAIVELAREREVSWFRGSEWDVLSRFVGAAKQARADIVVRMTADCPLMDHEAIDRVVRELFEYMSCCDYAANLLDRTYPRGLDVEAFCYDTLLRIERLATSAPAREHVTIVPRSERPDLFLIRSVKDEEDNSDLRWTVDTADDFEAMQRLYEKLAIGNSTMSYREILEFVRSNPEYASLDMEGSTWDPTSRAA